MAVMLNRMTANAANKEQSGELQAITMKPLTTKERFSRIFEHKEPDRIALWDFPWPGTLRRWRAEGMPLNVSFEDYFGFDKVGHIVVDPSPRYPAAVIEEDDAFITATTEWGATVRNFKDVSLNTMKRITALVNELGAY
jgi:hypothetical protein